MTHPTFEAYRKLIRLEAIRRGKRSPYDVDIDDLQQEGALGFLQAIQRFDAQRGIHFSTFAVRRIRGQMLDYLRTLGSPRQRGEEGSRELEWKTAFGDTNGTPYFLRWPFDVREALHEALRTLSKKQQRLLELYYAEELTFREIAPMMHLSEAQLARIHNQTLLQLKAKLKDYR